MIARPAPPGSLPPAALPPADAATWARVRRYAVPRWMIERATEARLAGDWRAACAAAAVDVPEDLDPERIADRYGPDVAARVADDLRHLAPDLLRWHLPRVLGGHTTIAPARRVVLASYGSTGPVLSLTTSPMLEGPQRLPLHFGPVRPPARDKLHGLTYATEDWTAARRFWDARHSAELRHSAGPSTSGRLPFLRPDGTPLSAGELPTEDPGSSDPAARAEWVAVLQARGAHVEAYAAAGLELDLTPPPQVRRMQPLDVTELLGYIAPDLTRLAPEIRRLGHAGRGTRFHVRVEWRGHLLVELDPTDADETRARVVGRERRREEDAPPLPGYVWQRLPDIGLLRAGRIRPEDLHPLVTAALFPHAGPAVGPPGPKTPTPVRVRCRDGAWHEVVSRNGVLDIPHTEQERQRELALRAFGGTVTGCFATQHAWAGGEGRLPRALREQRRELFQHVQHGDTPAVLALLDAGTDPHVRDRMGRGLLHRLHLLDHRELLPRLLAAGLDLEAKDRTQRTPLQSAVQWGGSAALVRDLLDAGARIDVTDEMELSLAQVIRRYERTDLMFLRRRVLKEHPGVGPEWFDDYMSERDAEPDWDEEDGPGQEPDPFEESAPIDEADPFDASEPFGEPAPSLGPDHPAAQDEDVRA